MPSWVIVGATRGIGFEYVNQLSADSNNVVFALIRSENTAGPLKKLAAACKNVHVIETDISDAARLKATAEQIGKITDSTLDVLVYNPAFPGTDFASSPSTFLGREPDLEKEILETMKVNVLYAMYTINALIPLVRNGKSKKIVYISSGMGDVDVVRTSGIPAQVGYASSKAAGNVVMAKYAAELHSEGISVLSLSPGWVATDGATLLKKESPGVIDFLTTAFQRIDPTVTGMITTEDSVKHQLKVIDGLTLEQSGSFVSHHGNRSWF